jgi:hypothetical protein
MTDDIERATAKLREKILKGEFERSPFPHMMIDPALEWDEYEKLEESFPKPELIYRDKKVVNNLAYYMGAVDTLKHPEIDPVWKHLFESIANPDFFRAVLEAVAPHTRRLCPDFEERLGKRMEEGSLALRGSGEEADFYFDVQISVNSPVLRKSRVRAIHVDRTVKILNALLYMRHPDDDVSGGELEMYTWKAERRFEKVNAPEDSATPVARHAYAKNRMLMFANSPDSLHGVTPRSETKIVRRYINILLETRIPLFDLTEYQVKKTLHDRIKKLLERK